MIFRVWAPIPDRMELQMDGKRIPMERGPEDWWFAEAAAGHGTNYAFFVDGDGPLPDPRSPWQPSGVHEPSRVIDHAFAWTDAGWQAVPLSAAVFYELHIGTFTPRGTFEAAIERLDYLKELGITHIELMPVNQFSGNHGWGYDGVDLFAPHHAYGDPNDLKRLVNACHNRGMAVVLDVVYNHLGPVGNYLSRFGPYFSRWHSTPWGEAVNLDGRGSDEVRRFFCDNALMWLRDYHFDGLRIDAIHAIVDLSATHLLEQLAVEVRELEAETGRHLSLIAESDLNDPRVLRPTAAGGYGIDAQWSDDFHHALHAVLTGETSGYYGGFGSLSHLDKALCNAWVYDGCYSAYRGRRHGRPPNGISGSQFLGYMQNHDQIGNRAKGDRSSHLMSVGRLKIAAALVFTAPFVPLLFQGEEWGASTPFLYFADHAEPAIAKAVREGRRSEFSAFGWDPMGIPDPQDPQTFVRSKLNWSELSHEAHAALLDWHRRLIRLRRETPDLADGSLEKIRVRNDPEAGTFVFRRGEITVTFNLAPQVQAVPLDPAEPHRLIMASETGVELASNAVRLPRDSVAILRA